MFQKFLSRKLIVSVIAFITVAISNLPADAKTKYGTIIALFYTVSQGFADAFGSAKAGASQGDPPA